MAIIQYDGRAVPPATCLTGPRLIASCSSCSGDRPGLRRGGHGHRRSIRVRDRWSCSRTATSATSTAPSSLEGSGPGSGAEPEVLPDNIVESFRPSGAARGVAWRPGSLVLSRPPVLTGRSPHSPSGARLPPSRLVHEAVGEGSSWRPVISGLSDPGERAAHRHATNPYVFELADPRPAGRRRRSLAADRLDDG